MSRISIGLLIAVIVTGNVITIGMLLTERRAEPSSGLVRFTEADTTLGSLVDTVDALRGEIDRLAERTTFPGDGPAAADAGGPASGPSERDPPFRDQPGRLDDVLERLDRIEETLAAMKELSDDVAIAELREKRLRQFRSEEGFALADELLAEKKFAVGANGILSFLDAHPDHPDARDLLQKARQAFTQAGYRDKAIWVQEELMKRFPEHRDADLYSLALMEKQVRRYDDAVAHMNESIELADTDQDRINRMFYRAYLIHERDGDAAGLAAYREVAREARTAGTSRKAGDEATKRAEEIEARLAGR